eukprot:TRINITY_DN26094_c0_g1_i1.p1 TRINITY_DN26094_c0_g1~~TRINITY_DN26094_c0_g1_i1.p1  ORF type:complete len:287 (-),score=51.00 TRINITY_DN26094_c0_g1_i1:41-901(-)
MSWSTEVPPEIVVDAAASATIAAEALSQLLTHPHQPNHVVAMMQIENVRLKQQTALLKTALLQTLQKMEKLQDHPTDRKDQEEMLTPETVTPELLTPPSSPQLSRAASQIPLLRPPPGLNLPGSSQRSHAIEAVGFGSDGSTMTRITWRVVNPHGKFRVSAGYPLVSQEVDTKSLGQLRLIFSPGKLFLLQEQNKKKIMNRKVKAQLMSLPAFGTLQVKFSDCRATIQRFIKVALFMGSKIIDTFIVDLKAASTVQGCSIPTDWRQEHEESKDGCLTFSAEITQVA